MVKVVREMMVANIITSKTGGKKGHNQGSNEGGET